MKRLLGNFPGLKSSQVLAAVGYAEAYYEERPEEGYGGKPPFTHEVTV